MCGGECSSSSSRGWVFICVLRQALCARDGVCQQFSLRVVAPCLTFASPPGTEGARTSFCALSQKVGYRAPKYMGDDQVWHKHDRRKVWQIEKAIGGRRQEGVDVGRIRSISHQLNSLRVKRFNCCLSPLHTRVFLVIGRLCATRWSRFGLVFIYAK